MLKRNGYLPVLLTIAVVLIAAVLLYTYNPFPAQEQPVPSGIGAEETGPGETVQGETGPGGTGQELEETANWPVYRNEDHKFEIKYPQEWGFAIGTPAERFGGSVKAVIEFGPKGKDGSGNTAKPLSVSVFTATYEEFYAFYPNMSMLGTTPDEPQKQFYLFTNSKNGPIFLITDESLLATTNEDEKAEFQNTISKMIETFRFEE